ncbi:hypothetical protein QCA50_009113 [Cerrena zonata]|uniref:Protein kinase domain-containing protein n=1 Tax=Cerrena zonata TaxID=2478898 RepID=A0AAW0GCN6_9APHY
MYSGIVIPNFDSLPRHVRASTGNLRYGVDLDFNVELPITLKPSRVDLPRPFSSYISGAESDNAATVKFICVSETKEQRIARNDVWDIQPHHLHLYRGHLSWANDDTENVAVICKMAYNPIAISKLRHEAHIYMNELNHLQGKYIPYFYGMFSNEEGTMACTILQHGGDAVEPLKVKDLSLATKELILKAVLSIHAAGVLHNRLRRPSWWHILLSQGPDSPNTPQPMIVDFKYATTGHQCPDGKKKRDEYRIGDWAPSGADFGCTELYSFLGSLAVWIPHFTFFHGTQIPAVHCESRETILDYLKRADNIRLPSSQIEAEETEKKVVEFKECYEDFLATHVRWPQKIYGSGKSESSSEEPKSYLELSSEEAQKWFQGRCNENMNVRSISA